MKKLSAFIILIILALTSCLKEDQHQIAYYQFRDSDLEKLLSYEVDQYFVYKNGNGEERTYRVASFNRTKSRMILIYTGNDPLPPESLYYYDSLEIGLLAINSNTSFNYHFGQFPNYAYADLARENIYTEYPSSFSGLILGFPYWNANNTFGSLNIRINYDDDISEMSINGVVYNHVLTILSGNSEPLDVVNNVHIIYYDIQNGIIGFDDLDGNEWRIQ